MYMISNGETEIGVGSMKKVGSTERRKRVRKRVEKARRESA
jgi:hypothetical protein